MPTTVVLHRAPRGQYRVISTDRDTGHAQVERDFWDVNDAHGYIYETADDRPWIEMRIYDDRGEEVEEACLE